MWQQIYDPLGNSFLSAALAALPILFFVVALTLLKLKGLNAALLTLVLALLVALFGFGMPLEKVLAAAAFGMLSGFWPIGAIVLMAVWLYKLAVKSGKFEVIRGSIAVVSEDQRIHVILIAFCFGAFLEGAVGFGVPIAICAALLVELGFRPVKAAMLCLLANAAAGAYGAIGIPVLVGAQQGGVDIADLSLMMIAIVQLSTLFVPTLLILVLDGWRGIRETWPVLLLIGLLFSGVQTATLLLLGPELTDIIAPLASMGALAAFMQVWRPRHIYREDGAPLISSKRWSLREVIAAWSPFYILTGAILLWSLPAFKALFGATIQFLSHGREARVLGKTRGTVLPIRDDDNAVAAKPAPLIIEPSAHFCKIRLEGVYASLERTPRISLRAIDRATEAAETLGRARIIDVAVSEGKKAKTLLDRGNRIFGVRIHKNVEVDRLSLPRLGMSAEFDVGNDKIEVLQPAFSSGCYDLL